MPGKQETPHLKRAWRRRSRPGMPLACQ